MIPGLVGRDKPTRSLLGFEPLGLGVGGEQSPPGWQGCSVALLCALHPLATLNDDSVRGEGGGWLPMSQPDQDGTTFVAVYFACDSFHSFAQRIPVPT